MTHSIKFKKQTVEIAPEYGGVLLSYALKLETGLLHILRPAHDGGEDPEQSACFPLLPFANRIREGRLSFKGQSIQLEKNDKGRHALHGFSWRTPWFVQEKQYGSILLTQRHEAGEWPWDYEAKQHISLSNQGLRIDLTVKNLSATEMPLGLGLHPYFPAPEQARLRANVESFHSIQPDTLEWSAHKDHPHVQSLRHSKALPIDLDNYFDGWTGRAQIDWPTHRVELSASDNLPYLALYSPKAERFFCLEPVSHPVNHLPPHGLPPGQSHKVWVSINAFLKRENRTM